VALFKLGVTAVVILIVVLISAAIIVSLNTGKFALTLGLTFVFLLFATIMNRIIDSYGD
jgi:hypothetical protein